MSSAQTSLQEKEPPPDRTLAAFIEAFARVFKIGIYYPLGHAVLDQATAKFVQQLREISPDLRSVRVVVTSSQILVEDQAVNISSGSARDLHQFLVKLGIQSITFARTLQHKHFLQFTKNLLTWRVKLESTRSLIDFDLGEVPEGIQVEQQRYQGGGSTDSLEHSGQDRQQLEEVFATLRAQGLTTSQVAQCRELIENHIAASGGREIDIKGYPNATWKDVQVLLHKIVTGGYSTLEHRFEAVANTDINVLSAIFRSLERNSTDKRAQESIHLLVSHLTGGTTRSESPPSPDKGLAGRQAGSPVSLPPGKRRRADSVQPRSTVAELKGYLADNDIPLKILERLVAVDRSEELSILLQVAGGMVSTAILEAVQNRLAGIVSVNLSDREQNVLIAGLVDRIDTDSDNDRFAWLITEILTTIRSYEPARSLLLLVEVWRRTAAPLQTAIWPFMVNEILLLGHQTGGDAFYECLEISSRLPVERMRQLRPQLEEMPVFQDKSIAADVFRPAYIYCYRLFAFLLETSVAEKIAEQVLAGLRQDPQDWLGAAIMPWLDIQVPEQHDFFRRYLLQAGSKEPPLSLKMAAGDLLASYLIKLDPALRETQWLPATISAARKLSSKALPGVLQRVVDDKRLFIVPAWPQACRQAAGEALKILNRQVLKELL